MAKNEVIEFLEERIASYRQKINKLKAQSDAIDAEIRRLQSLLESTIEILNEEQGQPSLPNMANSENQHLYKKIAILSLTDAITEIVRSSKSPIHADQIMKKLREAGKAPRAKNPKNSVVALLHRGVKSGLYMKVGGNLFAPFPKSEKQGEPS